MLIPNRPSWLRPSLTTLAALVLAATVVAQEAAAPAPAPAPAAQPKASPSPEMPKRAPRPGDIQKVFVIRHVKARILAEVLAAFPATITYSTYGQSSGLGVSAAPAVMAAIEETIKRLDVPEAPAKSVEVTAYVIEALSATAPDAGVPAVLEPIIAQLKATFRYADYRLADTFITRGVADGSAQIDVSSLSETQTSQPEAARYELKARPSLVPGEGRDTVRLGGLRFSVSMLLGGTTGRQWNTQGVSGSIDLPDGQYVVVGKSGTGQPGNARILVLRAKIVD